MKIVKGRYRFALEKRTLADIRALGGNDAEDDHRFATVARLSEVNESLYQTFVRPAVRAAVTPAIADAIREMHPNRFGFGFFSDRNPFVAASRRSPKPSGGTDVPQRRAIPFHIRKPGIRLDRNEPGSYGRKRAMRWWNITFSAFTSSPLLQSTAASMRRSPTCTGVSSTTSHVRPLPTVFVRRLEAPSTAVASSRRLCAPSLTFSSR